MYIHIFKKKKKMRTNKKPAIICFNSVSQFDIFKPMRRVFWFIRTNLAKMMMMNDNKNIMKIQEPF